MRSALNLRRGSGIYTKRKPPMLLFFLWCQYGETRWAPCQHRGIGGCWLLQQPFPESGEGWACIVQQGKSLRSGLDDKDCCWFLDDDNELKSSVSVFLYVIKEGRHKLLMKYSRVSRRVSHSHTHALFIILQYWCRFCCLNQYVDQCMHG